MVGSNEEDSFLVQDVVTVLSELGLRDAKPKNRKHLQFKQLDGKSIRMMNRLVKYLSENRMKANMLLINHTYTIIIKTQKCERKDEVIRGDDFFEVLQ